MPRAKDNTPADPVAETEHGFAALEARVEEMQVEAAIEAELAAEDTAFAVASVPVETIAPVEAAVEAIAEPAPLQAAADPIPPLEIPAPAPTAPLGAVQAMLSAFGECAQASLRFQADTVASFASVRSPRDLLAAQMAYGERAMKLSAGALASMTQALPAFAPRSASL